MVLKAIKRFIQIIHITTKNIINNNNNNQTITHVKTKSKNKSTQIYKKNNNKIPQITRVAA